MGTYQLLILVQRLFDIYGWLIIAWCLMSWIPMRPGAFLDDLRGALGMNARADRWAAAKGGRLESDDMADKVEDMLGVVGDASATQYRGERSCSARGSRYHAAVCAGECAEYMIAEGYLPVEY